MACVYLLCWQLRWCGFFCGTGKRAGRAELAFLRATAYLAGGHAEQALRDVQVALVYGPQAPSKSVGSGSAAAGLSERSCWPAAWALASAVHETMGESVPAVLALWKAVELEPDGPAERQEGVERLLRRIPEEHVEELQVCCQRPRHWQACCPCLSTGNMGCAYVSIFIIHIASCTACLLLLAGQGVCRSRSISCQQEGRCKARVPEAATQVLLLL